MATPVTPRCITSNSNQPKSKTHFFSSEGQTTMSSSLQEAAATAQKKGKKFEAIFGSLDVSQVVLEESSSSAFSSHSEQRLQELRQRAQTKQQHDLQEQQLFETIRNRPKKDRNDSSLNHVIASMHTMERNREPQYKLQKKKKRDVTKKATPSKHKMRRTKR